MGFEHLEVGFEKQVSWEIELVTPSPSSFLFANCHTLVLSFMDKQ